MILMLVWNFGMSVSFLGGSLEDVRATLLHKHQKAKNRIDTLNVGGGVSIWPNMDDMRLTNGEVVGLLSASVVLCLMTVCLFNTVHGEWIYQDVY